MTRAEHHRKHWHKDIYSTYKHTHTHTAYCCIFSLLVFSGHSSNVLLLSVWNYLFQWCQSYVYRKSHVSLRRVDRKVFLWSWFWGVWLNSAQLHNNVFCFYSHSNTNCSFVGRFLSSPLLHVHSMPSCLAAKKAQHGLLLPKTTEYVELSVCTARLSLDRNVFLSFLFGAQIVSVQISRRIWYLLHKGWRWYYTTPITQSVWLQINIKNCTACTAAAALI